MHDDGKGARAAMLRLAGACVSDCSLRSRSTLTLASLIPSHPAFGRHAGQRRWPCCDAQPAHALQRLLLLYRDGIASCGKFSTWAHSAEQCVRWSCGLVRTRRISGVRSTSALSGGRWDGSVVRGDTRNAPVDERGRAVGGTSEQAAWTSHSCEPLVRGSRSELLVREN